MFTYLLWPSPASHLLYQLDAQLLIYGEAGLQAVTGPDLRGGGFGLQVSHQQRTSHQTVHILFLADDRCLRDSAPLLPFEPPCNSMSPP